MNDYTMGLIKQSSLTYFHANSFAVRNQGFRFELGYVKNRNIVKSPNCLIYRYYG